jgi:catechol 2,3-dioxygenase-like lactoylglutathione lyase family enzyme
VAPGYFGTAPGDARGRTSKRFAVAICTTNQTRGSVRGLVLSSNDILADYDDMRAKGVEFEGPPESRPWGVEETVLYDPDGNALVLQG